MKATVTSKDGIDLRVEVQAKNELQRKLAELDLRRFALKVDADYLIDDGFELITEGVQS